MALRDLTRRRKRLLNAANSERGSVKFGNVVSDVFGASGQRFLQALFGDQPTTAEQIAQLAKGRLRSKLPLIAEALEGHRLDEHLKWMIRHSLDHLVFLEKQMAELRGRIAAALAPLERQFELLQTIPGVGEEIAAVILAETGGNMAQFPASGI